MNEPESRTLEIVMAGQLATPPVTFPGGHDGFLTDPAAFALTLRTVLDH